MKAVVMAGAKGRDAPAHIKPPSNRWCPIYRQAVHAAQHRAAVPVSKTFVVTLLPR